MSGTLEQPTTREDVIRAMRELATRGTTVRELVQVVHTRLGYPEDAVLPVMWYFSEAFGLPLKDVLPLREWLGTDRDEEIDALMLPAIAKARSQWLPSTVSPGNGADREVSRDHGPTASDHRS